MNWMPPGGLIAGLLFSFAAQAFDVAGVPVDSKTRVETQEVALNGAGVRNRLMFKIYVAALYVAEPSTQAAAILRQPGAKRLILTLLRDVSADTMIAAMQEGKKKNLSAEEYAGLGSATEQFSAIFRAVGDGRKGDRISLDWVPAQGTVVLVNGAQRGQPIPDETFYRALLKIWLGEHPAQASLKDALLGR